MSAELNGWRLVVMTAILGAALALALCMTGCGEMMVPGGTSLIQYKVGEGFYVRSNKDTSFGKLVVDPATGLLTVENYSGNGSNLGAQQAATSQLALQMSTQSYLATMQLIGLLAPQLLSGGIGGIGGAVPATQPVVDTPAQALQRQAILTKIANCPFLAAVPVQQAYFTARVKAASPSELAEIQAIVDRLSAIPATVIP